jgi:broad specificity phosphatase PhoE
MRLVFVRHAESTANAEGRYQGHSEHELSQRGRTQAEQLSERFLREGFEPTHVYSSPLARTRETAAILARRWPVDVDYLDDLMEYDIGVLSGLNDAEIAAKYPALDMELEWSRQLAGVEGAEPLQARRARAGRVVERAVGSHQAGDTVLMVTHGGILQHIVAELLGTDRTWGTTVHNTGVFDFSIDKERWSLDGEHLLIGTYFRINRFNDASHLVQEP